MQQTFKYKIYFCENIFTFFEYGYTNFNAKFVSYFLNFLHSLQFSCSSLIQILFSLSSFPQRNLLLPFSSLLDVLICLHSCTYCCFVRPLFSQPIKRNRDKNKKTKIWLGLLSRFLLFSKCVLTSNNNCNIKIKF